MSGTLAALFTVLGDFSFKEARLKKPQEKIVGMSLVLLVLWSYFNLSPFWLLGVIHFYVRQLLKTKINHCLLKRKKTNDCWGVDFNFAKTWWHKGLTMRSCPQQLAQTTAVWAYCSPQQVCSFHFTFTHICKSFLWPFNHSIGLWASKCAPWSM